MRELIAGIAIGFLLTFGVTAYLDWRASRPARHRLRGNYFDAQAPFAIVRIGRPIEERSDERVDKMAHRLGKLRDRKWTDGDRDASARG